MPRPARRPTPAERAVACPRCGAAAGAVCVRAYVPHAARLKAYAADVAERRVMLYAADVAERRVMLYAADVAERRVMLVDVLAMIEQLDEVMSSGAPATARKVVR